MINELPYNHRIAKKNTIVAGLWFGTTKPVVNLFLSVFEPDLQKLYTGIDFAIPNEHQTIKVRGLIACGTCDLPAKAIFLNLQQYNGKHGCPHCEIETKKIDNKYQTYPYIEDILLRTTDSTNAYAEDAVRLKKPVCGVKGPSYLNIIAYDFITADEVEKFGPLWVVSCFPFENFNGLLKKYVCGSNRPQLQISSAITECINIQEIKNNYIEKDSDVFLFCNRIEKLGTHRRRLQKLSGNMYIEGKSVRSSQLEEYVEKCFEDNGIHVHYNKLHTYQKLLKNNVYYETDTKSQNKKSNSSCITYLVQDEPDPNVKTLKRRKISDMESKNQQPKYNYPSFCEQHCMMDANFNDPLTEQCTTQNHFYVNSSFRSSPERRYKGIYTPVTSSTCAVPTTLFQPSSPERRSYLLSCTSANIRCPNLIDFSVIS
uniref:Uncharacterized protein n=1 Tax=Trichogramma kaykai TaxID=54128 RepID=A0ABD2WF79_9HYME